MVDGEGRSRQRRGQQDVEALKQRLRPAIHGGPLAQRIRPVHRGPPGAALHRLAQASRHLVAKRRHVRPDARGQAGLQHDEEGVLEGREVLLDRVDLRARAFQVAHRGLAGREHLGIDEAVADTREPPDAKSAHGDVARIVGRLRARIGIARVDTGDRVEAGGRLRHGSRHRSDVRRRREEIGLMDVRHASKRGLEPDDAAAGGGDPDRAAAVGAEGQRGLSARDRGGGASGGAARGAREVPWVPRHAEQRAVGEGLVSELRRGGLADENGAGLAEPSHGHRVLGGHLGGIDQRPHRRADPLGEHEVLHGEGHAVERPEPFTTHHRGLGAPRGVARLVRRHRDERVDGGLKRLDAREHRIHHRDGRHLLGTDQAGEGQRVDVDHGRCLRVILTSPSASRPRRARRTPSR
jgi:hypothetical protein